MLRSSCGTLFLCGLAALTAAGGDQPGTGADRNGDPLPQGALARFGTLRWRHAGSVSFVTFLPGGREVLTAGLDHTARVWDRATGKELRRFRLPAARDQGLMAVPAVNVIPLRAGGPAPVIAVTDDGKTLALATPNQQIRLVSIATGEETRVFVGPTSGVAAMRFSPDGKTLAIRDGTRLVRLFDVESGDQVRQIAPRPPAGPAPIFVVGPGGGSAGEIAFSPDGKTLACTETEIDMQQLRAFVRVVAVTTGAEVRRLALAATGVSAVAFSPNGKLLACAGGNRVQLYDAATGAEVRQIDAPGGAAMLAFAPDSATVAAASLDQAVRLWETATGKLLHQLGPASGLARNGPAVLRFGAGQALCVAFSPDGKAVAAGSGNVVRIWDVASGKEEPLAGGHRGPITALAVAADGKTVLSHGADHLVRRWDLSGAERSHFVTPALATAVAFAPDGQTVALADGGAIHVHDAATGKRLHQLPGHPNAAAALAFAPGGRVLASQGVLDNQIRLADPVKGTALRQIALQSGDPAPAGAVVVRATFDGSRLAFTSDGRTLIGQVFTNSPAFVPVPAAASRLRLWDVATGKEVHSFALPAQRGGGSIAVSPDGRVVAAEDPTGTVSLWELAGGKERGHFGKFNPTAPAGPAVAMRFVRAGAARFARPATGAITLAFSPDGVLLAGKGPGNAVVVWDADTGKELTRFVGHQGPVTALAFTPDGKALASGSDDTTILLWDVARLDRAARAGAVALAPRQLDELWADLAGDDASKAFEGIRKLAAAPAAALPFLAAQLQPTAPVDPKKLDQLLADLDSEEFEARRAAAEALAKLGDLAVPALEKMQAAPTLETRRRVEQLLARLTGGVLSAEQLRVVRAVEALERTGTPEARRLLEALAAGAPGALPTRQAQAALERLRRPKAAG